LQIAAVAKNFMRGQKAAIRPGGWVGKKYSYRLKPLQNKAETDFAPDAARVGIAVAKAACANVSLAGRAQLNQQPK
jgi:hypothetical protein